MIKIIKSFFIADTIISNCVTLNLQRHSDHHANAFKHYQCLETIDNTYWACWNDGVGFG
eukprot:gene11375-4543_t